MPKRTNGGFYGATTTTNSQQQQPTEERLPIATALPECEAEAVIIDEESNNGSVPRLVANEVDPLMAATTAPGSPSSHPDLRLNDSDEQEKGPTCRDLPFAVLFYAHFATMIWLGVAVAPKGYEGIDVDFGAIEQRIHDSGEVSEEDFREFKEFVGEVMKYVQVFPSRIFWYLVFPCIVLAFIISYVGTAAILKPCPRFMVYGCLFKTFAFTGFILILACIAAQSALVWIVSSLILLGVLYFVAVSWQVVPFVAVNLKAALQGIIQNGGMYFVAFVFAKIGLLWVIYWFYVVVGVFSYQSEQCRAAHPDANFDMSSDDYSNVCDPPLMVVLAFLLSIYWTSTVTMNVIQVTVAGVMATWCLDQDEADQCCSFAVIGSLFRSVTYSFGSICFGSLLQVFVALLRVSMEHTRVQRERFDQSNDCGSFLFCLCDCVAQCLEDLIYAFNQFAYTYAGIYGYSYIESGRRVMDLFKSRGWTTIISNQLLGYVLFYTHLAVGIVTGIVAIALDWGLTMLCQDEDSQYDSYLFGTIPGWRYCAFAVGFLCGSWVCSILTHVVHGAVNALIVCWADSPAVLEQNHPELTSEMGEAWSRVFPEFKPDLSSYRNGSRI